MSMKFRHFRHSLRDLSTNLYTRHHFRHL